MTAKLPQLIKRTPATFCWLADLNIIVIIHRSCCQPMGKSIHSPIHPPPGFRFTFLKSECSVIGGGLKFNAIYNLHTRIDTTYALLYGSICCTPTALGVDLHLVPFSLLDGVVLVIPSKVSSSHHRVFRSTSVFHSSETIPASSPDPSRAQWSSSV